MLYKISISYGILLNILKKDNFWFARILKLNET